MLATQRAASHGLYAIRGDELAKLVAKGQVLVQSSGQPSIDWRTCVKQFLRSQGVSEFATTQLGARYKTGTGTHLNSTWRNVISDLRKHQGRNPVLLSKLTLVDYALRKFHKDSPLVGKNKKPGFTERQALAYFSNMKVIMSARKTTAK